jgi:hypothetical protein
MPDDFPALPTEGKSSLAAEGHVVQTGIIPRKKQGEKAKDVFNLSYRRKSQI